MKTIEYNGITFYHDSTIKSDYLSVTIEEYVNADRTKCLQLFDDGEIEIFDIIA